jgi:uncharacterized hydrophobic protein (TIGR00271 family)
MLERLFSLRPATDYEGTLAQVRADAELRGGAAWALVFAIVIASVGLDVNSTAVIIGAMLISPLMGPIVGLGFALATSDVPLLRLSLRNLVSATLLAVLASTLYFAVSPLDDARSELLARTRPTLYDVVIALFGGGAGAVAVTRKGAKGNAVPGVAIATALMPPLCTAGYGLAQRNHAYVTGALELFLINALFIGLATYALVRLLAFPRVASPSPERTAWTRAVVTALVIGVVVPSAYAAWNVVRETRFRRAAQRFIAERVKARDRAVVDVDLRYAPPGSVLSATVFGPQLSAEALRSLESQLPAYGLDGARLELRQPGGVASVEQIVDSVRQDLLARASRHSEQAVLERELRLRELEADVARLRALDLPIAELAGEVRTLYPRLARLGVGHEVAIDSDGGSAATPVVVASWRGTLPPRADRDRLQAFCARRLGVPALRLLNTLEHP